MNEAELEKLWIAARAGQVNTIKKLIAQLDPKHSKDKDLLSRALAQAVLSRAGEAVTLLLKAGANPEQTTSLGTLLSIAAMNGELPIVKKLIQAGANLNREIKRETPLSAALSQNAVPVIEYLEKLGGISPPNTTLLYACQNGDMKRAQAALNAGAETEKPGGIFEETPLMAAARTGQVEAVKLLLSHGANPNTQIKHNTALFDAVRHGKSLAILDLLIAAGGNIHVKNYEETLLMAAAEGGSLALVKCLVQRGADLSAVDKNFNKTALDIAKSQKHKELVKYLSSLGAKSDRNGGRALMKILAREYGGKCLEHAHGFTLKTKLGGWHCQFHAGPAKASVMVFQLKYADADLKRYEKLSLHIGLTPPAIRKTVVKSASDLLGVCVWMKDEENALSEKSATEFCRRHQGLLKELGLSSRDYLGVTSQAASFFWQEEDEATTLRRLNHFEKFLQAISRPPQPERLWFKNEWLLKPAPKSTSHNGTPHALGGTWMPPVACPQCGCANNLMARIDLADPALPNTDLGRRMLPLFWCRSCQEWEAAFWDISHPIAKILQAQGKNAKKIEPGEQDLPERRIQLVPVPAGKKAGAKSKLGGAPNWIQSPATPNCPKCDKPMAFMLQLASNSPIAYGDMGMLYAFACPECKMAASVVQSH